MRAGERWVILGANGAGKTTLLRVAALYQHPSRGTVDVLGERLGRCDVRTLRERTPGFLARRSRPAEPRMTASEVVMTAKYAALRRGGTPTPPRIAQHALELLEHFRRARSRAPAPDALGRGARRVLLARTLMNEPGIVLLDEPTAGLDVGGREELVHDLTQWARDAAWPPLVLVTHHLEEIPPGFTHALVMKDARVLTFGTVGGDTRQRPKCSATRSAFDCAAPSTSPTAATRLDSYERAGQRRRGT